MEEEKNIEFVEVKEKKKKPKLGWFILKMIILLLIVFFTSQFAGIFIGEFFKSIVNYGKYGADFFYEMLWAIIALFIMLLSKNSYVFKEKREGFFKAILKGWPYLVFSLFLIVLTTIGLLFFDGKIDLMNLLSLILLCIFIGIFEEFMCRGWIQNEFMERFGSTRKGIIISILVSGILFGLLHSFNVFGGQNLTDTITQVLSTITGGIFLGAIYYRTKNIWSVVFIHAFYDFALFLSSVNVIKDCTSQEIAPNSIILISTLGTIFLMLVDLLMSSILLRKKKIEEELNQNNIIYDSTLEKKDKKRVIITTIILSVVLLLFIGTVVFPIDHKAYDSYYTCYEYKEMKIDEYELTYNNYDYFEISYDKEYLDETGISQKESYDFIVFYTNEEKISITNKINNNSLLLNYKDIYDFIVFENNNNYIIVLLQSNDNGETTAYISDYITSENISNDSSYLTKIENSFKKLEFPSIDRIGYLKEKGSDYKYPLLVSNTSDKFIIKKDNNIYILK